MIKERLSAILPRITDSSFLSSDGIGNEIACYIFDYSATDELLVREQIQVIMAHLTSHPSQPKALHLNLLDVCLEYLEHRRLLDKTIAMQKQKDSASLLRAMKGLMTGEKIRDFIASRYKLTDYDLILMSGVGSVWPMLRAHSLLNCMHTVLGHTPLVMFYPGSFDGTSLRLFGRIASSNNKSRTKNYYRAFRLVP